MSQKSIRAFRALTIVLIAGLSLFLLPGNFHSARAGISPFTFAAVGDFGQISSTGSCATAGTTLPGSCAYNVVSRIAAAQPVVPNFVVALGDLGYSAQRPSTLGTSPGWCTSFKAVYSGSLALVTGNHDTYNHANVHYTDGNPDVTVTDTLTNEANNGFLDDLAGGVQGYVSACGAPDGINWIGSSITSNGVSCSNSLQSESCYAREYYFDYPSTNPIMRFVVISAGICGPWFNAPQPCPSANGQPPSGANGWNPPTSPATCATPPAGSEHYCWLKQRIDEAKNAGLWVAVANHKECIMYSTNSCESTLSPFNLALLDGVDLWLNGHDHTYQRSVQITSTSSDPCTVDGSFEVNHCHLGDGGLGKSPNPAYTKGTGTVVNTIGTGGGTLDTNICSSLCPIDQSYFASLCGKNGVVSGLAQTAGCDNGGDYGFSTFTVNPDQITANYVSLGGFSDNYAIKVPNPPGDFSVNSGVVSVSQGIVGGSGIYSSFGTLNINSFGSFSSSVSLAVGSVSGGLAGTCPGSNCPTLSVSPTTVQPQADGTVSSTLTVSTTTGTPCGNPQQSPASEYSVTLTATSGSMTPRSLTVHIYVYAQSDPTKDGVDNIVDVALVNGLFGQNLGAPRYNPNIDLNNDGRINIIDVTIVNSRFGTGC